MLVVGINEGYSQHSKKLHDGSCVVLQNATIKAAISEERITREKRAGGYETSLAYLTSLLSIKPNDIDLIVTSSCCDYEPINSIKDTIFKKIPIIKCDHHLSHAYSTFYISPFSEAIVIVIDGGGNTLDNKNTMPWWQASREQHSYYFATENQIRLIHRDFDKANDTGMGEIYRAFTYYLGWPSSKYAGNIMAMAGCSNNKTDSKFKIFLEKNGRLSSQIRNDPFNPVEMVEGLLSSFKIKAKNRRPGEKIKEIHFDLAKWVQDEIEDALVLLVNKLVSETKVKNICFAGGVSYNCKAMNAIIKRSNAERIFVSPVAGDHGQALGNAIYGYKTSTKKQKIFIHNFSPYLGPDYDLSHSKICERIKLLELPLSIRISENKYEEVSKLLMEGYIIGWFQGRSEFGPRALGNRSILASPAAKEVTYRLNELKGREKFMPLAPSIMEEFTADYFEPFGTEYMSIAVFMKNQSSSWGTNVSHNDGTARIQIVRHKNNQPFYELIKSFYKLTGIPMLLNTSFNGSGEPIVETVDDALISFYRLNLDYLIIGDCIIEKENGDRSIEIKYMNEYFSGVKESEIPQVVKKIIPDLKLSKRSRVLLFNTYIDWVKQGKKKTTIRYGKGDIDIPMYISLPMMETKDFGNRCFKKVGTAVIKQLELKPFGELSQNDAINDGFDSLEDLKNAMNTIYGPIDNDHIMSIYTFSLVSLI